ncbi:hypothetical protein G3545_14240 [Starkeya sp. ORNL1]|uniref:PcfJ domain-containing protein n=1 Tax=Starkeya sp. ORNL1 TaxID=2709380 RepID=UPI001462D416|nr:PcfJ domain-containing protein [Starkeya sp. ORNL1]QJP14701.1 hypothetical protein G3545_14240 [Starkeya sp. ORNL1]
MLVGDDDPGTLFVNEDWREEAGARAHALFPSNRGMQTLAGLMARSHRFGIQYLEQAPAIIPFITAGGWAKTRPERMMISRHFGEAVHSGPRLKDLLARWQAPLPIRRISSSAVCRESFATIFMLRQIAPSDLAQMVPEKSRHQSEWLRAMREWRGREQWCSRLASPEMRRWAGLALSREIVAGHHPQRQVRDLTDFIMREPTRFSPKWSWMAALGSMEEWHQVLAKRSNEEKFLHQHGFRFEQQVDYTPLPESADVHGVRFTALRSGKDLWTEGAAMRHCVSTYVRDVMTGKSRIYSITLGERRVATMELQPFGKGWRIIQIKGPCNAVPVIGARQAAALLVEGINKSIATDEVAA